MLKNSKVYLRGAYGPGNLGDDVLLICMINILKERFSENEITIGVQDESVSKLFSESVNWVDYKMPFKSDYFIYGGGGQFFSFDNGGGKSADITDKGFFYKFIAFVKNNKNPYHAFLRVYLSIIGANENLVKSKNTASYSIGIGPFEIEGKGVERLKSFIQKVDFCSVRDNTSADYFHKHNEKNGKVKVFVDPTFNTDGWFHKDKTLKVGSGDYITYVVRDWPYTDYGNNLIKTMIEHARLKKSQGYKVRLCALFINKDLSVIRDNQDIEWLLYDLNKYSVSTFMVELIEKSKYICSARAHGVWLPTILGFPVLAVGIENKLREVSKSLGESSVITQAGDVDEFDKDFNKYIDDFEYMKSRIDSVVKARREIALDGQEQFLQWIDRCESI